ncbi:hypothetical protein E2F43_07855 [Seongchinamella unica]|uniref:Uncharacterized protein n=1 Tax=Seongchinamella unica TaxID=2547392 RepID=A0A4R5LRD9_9GAMM|nr:hypothetical protein [Seongchinamella unica]TDG13445.1 hypothetical protein E2F43_07855 [Seongchinamella unica]
MSRWIILIITLLLISAGGYGFTRTPGQRGSRRRRQPGPYDSIDGEFTAIDDSRGSCKRMRLEAARIQKPRI